MKKLKFPLIRTRFPKIRDLGVRAKKRYLVDSRPHVDRKCFSSIGEARTFADSVATELANRGTEAFALTTGERVMAVESAARLRSFGKTLRDATDHFISFLEHQRVQTASSTVSAALDLFLKARQADVARGELAKRSFVEVRYRAEQLRGAIGGMRLGEVDVPVLRQFLDSLPVGAQTKQSVRLRASKFWNWCVENKLATSNPCSEIKVKVRRGDTQILNVEQAEKLLKAALASKHDGVISYFAIACFAGCRPTEIQRLAWSSVDWSTKTLTVLGATSKVKETRYIPLSPTLQAWLRPIAKTSGPVIGRGFERTWRQVVTAAGLRPWVPDVCRHSFASCHLALHKDRAHLAELLGNSVRVIRLHYRAPVLESEARRYFALTPGKLAKKGS